MLDAPVLIAVSLLYLGLLFAVAWWGDKRADQGRSIIANPTIYALSMAVYCTTWTFYGSVGRAAVSGIGFLPVYLGPTLVMALGWFAGQRGGAAAVALCWVGVHAVAALTMTPLVVRLWRRQLVVEKHV